MEEPHIIRVVPDVLENVRQAWDTAKIDIFGRNFSPNTEVHVIGQGFIVESLCLHEGLLKCQIDIYVHGESCLGIMVLNDPESFTPRSSSNVIPLRIRSTISPPNTDGDDVIPF